MASKRGLRRRRERVLRQKEEEFQMDQKKKLLGGVGKTSVADLILQRTKYLSPDQPKTSAPTPTIPVVHPPAQQENEPNKLISSSRHKEMIFREGLENRNYYLTRMAQDSNRLPWFRYVRKESQYSEFVTLNHEMAKQLLSHTWTEGDGNRKLKTQIKEAYKRDIENDSWIPSDESIGIDYNGVVYNGRHRLTAMSEVKKDWPFYITFNALEEAKFTVDSGAKRTSSEKLKLVIDTKLGNRTSGFCKALMRSLSTKQRFTETEVAEFAHKWQELVAWISLHLPIARGEVQAAIAKAYLWYGPEKIESFCARLREVRFVEDGDPARALYLALQKAKINRINQSTVAYKKTLSSIEAVINNKPIYRLYDREVDVFQWQDGYEIPSGAWWHTR